MKKTLTFETQIEPSATVGVYDVTCITLDQMIPSHGLQFSPAAFNEWLESRDQEQIIPLFRSHNSEIQIGSVDNFHVENNQLKARVYFSQNDDGRNVNTLIEEGHLQTFSVGINNIVWGGEEYDTIEQANLHELSTTAIPADAQARILSELEEFHYSMHCHGGACNTSKQLEKLARDALGLSAKGAKKAVSVFKQRDVEERQTRNLAATLNSINTLMEG